MRDIEAAERRAAFRRLVTSVVCVGAAGVLAIVLTFVHWGRNYYLHRNLTGWQLFTTYGLSFPVEDYGVDSSGEVFTGIATLIAGCLLVGVAALLALTFTTDVPLFELPYPKWTRISARTVGGIAIGVLGLTALSALAATGGLAVACFFIASLAAFGIFFVALPPEGLR